jgi:hypothetical protein
MPEHPEALACDLSALNGDERERRSALAAHVAQQFGEVRETPDGYAARLPPDPALIRDAVEWLLLERRCCPFLRLELRWEPSLGPIWLTLGGRPGVKEFLAAAGLEPLFPEGQR